MKLSQVMNGISFQTLQGNSDIEISEIRYDSRQTKENDVFVCVTGFTTDGHKYAQNSVALGAKALIVENDVKVAEDITVLRVQSTRAALAQMAANYYDNPSEKLKLVGVTGTNGKTSTTYIIKSILEEAGHKVGLIGTIENRIGEQIIKTDRTTPESLDLQKLLAEMVDAGVSHVVMEVSSHALDLLRVAGCQFHTAIFTNLTQDHLDYHLTMENYRAAKGILFAIAKNSVINLDDPSGTYMMDSARGSIMTTGIENRGDVYAKNIQMTADHVTFDLVYDKKVRRITMNLLGRFSIYNVLGSVGACLFLGIDLETIVRGIENIKGVRGRFETLRSAKGFNAVVDYSHTPDSLENAITTAKEFTSGRVITVFGCGGDRDRTKRPVMGEIAGRLSDYCIITSDNPRSENPLLILRDVEEGVKQTDCPYVKIADRREAIYKAVQDAKEGDLILVAGKGHETYQIFPDKTVHFDDKEVILEAFGEDRE